MRIRVGRIALVAMASLLATGCGPGSAFSGADQAVAFTTSKDVGGVAISGIVPSGVVVNFSLPPMHNQTANRVQILKAQLISPPRSVIHVLSVRAYLAQQTGLGWFNGYQGDLPKNCPEHFKPHPLTDAITRGHSSSNWLVVISLVIPRAGRLHLGTAKITYRSGGHVKWQYYYLNVALKAASPKTDPQYVETYRCSRKAGGT